MRIGRKVITVFGIVSLALLLVSISGITSCASPAPGSAPAPAAKAKPIKLRYSGGLEPSNHISSEQKWFAEELQKRTNGRVTVEAYMGAELYDHSQVIDAISTGAIEMGYTMLGRWTSRNPVFGFYNYMMMVDVEHFRRAADGLRKILFPITEKDSVKTLHWFNDSQSAYGGNKPLVKPEDMKGLIIRAGAQETNTMLKLLGAVPAQMESGGEYDALAKGTIDGTWSGWASLYSRKMYEVTKHFTGPFAVTPVICQINPDVWKSLPEDIQKTITDLSKEMEVLSFKNSEEYAAKALEMLKTKGTVTIIEGELKNAWAKAARPAWDEWVKSCEKKGTADQAREIIKLLDATR